MDEEDKRAMDRALEAEKAYDSNSVCEHCGGWLFFNSMGRFECEECAMVAK